jgi:streptogramin lyase
LREGNAILQLNLHEQTLTRAAGTGKKGFSGDDGPATSAALNGPKGLSIAPNGDVIFADTENHAIRSLNVRTHSLSTLAGTGRPGDGTETEPLHCALNRPHGVFVDRQGAVFIGDTDANRVRVIRP